MNSINRGFTPFTLLNDSMQTHQSPSEAESEDESDAPHQHLRPTVYQQSNLTRRVLKDVLSNLQSNILLKIFEYVRVANGVTQMRGGISKTLLPYTNANLYYRVEFRSSSKLELFARTIALNGQFFVNVQREKSLGSLVKYFIVSLREEWYSDGGWEDFDERELLAALTSMTNFYCKGSDLLTASLLSSRSSQPQLTSLKVLTVAGTTYKEVAFKMANFVSLSSYTNLDRLVLIFHEAPWHESKQKRTIPPLRTAPVNFRLNMTTLALNGDFEYTTSNDLATFLSYFPNLATLSIEDAQCRLDLVTVVSRMTADLKCLILDLYADVKKSINFELALRRFPSLHTLKLHNVNFDKTTMPAILKRSQLKLLCISCTWWTTCPGAALLDVLNWNAYSGNSTVKELVIEVPLGSTSSSLYDLIMPDYMRVIWPEDFTRHHAQWFVAEAAKRRIKISGNLLEAIYNDSKFL